MLVPLVWVAQWAWLAASLQQVHQAQHRSQLAPQHRVRAVASSLPLALVTLETVALWTSPPERQARTTTKVAASFSPEAVVAQLLVVLVAPSTLRAALVLARLEVQFHSSLVQERQRRAAVWRWRALHLVLAVSAARLPSALEPQAVASLDRWHFRVAHQSAALEVTSRSLLALAMLVLAVIFCWTLVKRAQLAALVVKLRWMAEVQLVQLESAARLPWRAAVAPQRVALWPCLVALELQRQAEVSLSGVRTPDRVAWAVPSISRVALRLQERLAARRWALALLLEVRVVASTLLLALVTVALAVLFKSLQARAQPLLEVRLASRAAPARQHQAERSRLHRQALARAARAV
jgi:hypothetical protein